MNENEMLINLLTAVKSSWHAKLTFMANYINAPLNENAIDLDYMIDQIWAEEICKKSNMKSR